MTHRAPRGVMSKTEARKTINAPGPFSKHSHRSETCKAHLRLEHLSSWNASPTQYTGWTSQRGHMRRLTSHKAVTGCMWDRQRYLIKKAKRTNHSTPFLLMDNRNDRWRSGKGGELKDKVACLDGRMKVKLARNAFAGAGRIIHHIQWQYHYSSLLQSWRACSSASAASISTRGLFFRGSSSPATCTQPSPALNCQRSPG